METAFIKVHGSQNDFFIIDETEHKMTSWNDDFRHSLALKLCQRANALGGADGILYLTKSYLPEASYKMRVINADGSEASMCGNGLRTVARYVLEKIGEKKTKIETMKAVLSVSQAKSLGYEIPTYQVEISPVLFAKEALEMNYPDEQLFNQKWTDLDADLTFSAVAVPNPHLISFVDKYMLRSLKQEILARYLNNENPYFKDGVNVSFVRRLADDKIFVRTFERGVGFTNACGTAMSASSLIKKLIDHDKLEDVLAVYNDGGRVNVSIERDEKGDYVIQLIGNATFTAKGIVAVSEDGNLEIIQLEETNEQNNYLKLVQEVELFLLKNS